MATPTLTFLKTFALLALVVAMTALAIFAVLAMTGPREGYQPGYVLQFTYGPAFAQTAAQNAEDAQTLRQMGEVQSGFGGQPIAVTTVNAGQTKDAVKKTPDLRLILDGRSLAVYSGDYASEDIGAWVASRVGGIRYTA